MIKRIIGLSGALMLNGCAMFDSRSMVYDQSQLFVWRSEYSAGIGTQGGICAQAATTMKASNTDVDISGSDDWLKLAAPTLATTEHGELIDLGIAQNQTVALTNVTTAQTAFANIAFFYLCQISLNNKVSDESLVSMWSNTTAALATVGNSTGGTVNQIKADPVDTGSGRNVGAGGSDNSRTGAGGIEDGSTEGAATGAGTGGSGG